MAAQRSGLTQALALTNKRIATMKKSALAFLLLIPVHSNASEPGPAPVIQVPVNETCREHIVAEPRITAEDWPKRARGRNVNAYVVISYDLDGTGKPKNAQVTDSVPKGLFDRSTLSILDRTEFAQDAVAQSCIYVRTYGAVRRAER